MRNSVAAIFAMLLLVGAAGAQPPATQSAATQPAATQPSEDPATLIAQLDAPEFGVRELAEKKLAALGPAAESQLRQALKSNLSDEARTRVSSLLAQLDDFRTLHASITLHYANAPLTKILADFATQSGGDLGVTDPSVSKIVGDRAGSIDLDNAGFWDALRTVSALCGLKPSLSPAGITLAQLPGRVLMPIDLDNPYVCCTGGILIAPQASNKNESMSYVVSPGQKFGNMNFTINIVPEPKLHVLGVVSQDWVKDCVDENGNSLLNTSRRIRYPGFMILQGQRQFYWPMVTPLHIAPGMGTKIARLRGQLDLSAQTRSETFSIDDITRSREVTKSDGEIDVTVLSCSQVNQSYRIELSVHNRKQNPNNPGIQSFLNSVMLIDDQGGVIPRQGTAPQPMRNPNVMNVTFIFQPTPNPPVSLRWERTIEQKRISIPFELHDLPLP